MTPEELADLLKREGSGLTPDEYDETKEPEDATKRRTKLLADVLTTCQRARDEESEELDLLAEKLGDGSRDVAWRIPFGEAGLVAFFLEVLAVNNSRQSLYIHALRMVGNSCADTDENRARVVENDRMAGIIRRLQDENLIPFTIPVLFNVMVDYEPSQLLASKSAANQHLMTLLSLPNLDDYAALIPYFCKILALLVNQESEADIANPRTVEILLNLAMSEPYVNDLDDFAPLASVAGAYLGTEVFQAHVIKGSGLSVFLNAFTYAHTNFDLSQVEDPTAAASTLRELRAFLLTALADLSAHDSFASEHPLGSETTQTLLSWLKSPDHHLQTAACLALGNLSRSDEVSTGLVEEYSVHEPLISLLSNPATSDQQVLHSALSFLKNLGIPVSNKSKLGDLLVASCIQRMYELDTLPQVQFTAISLTRLLMVSCPENARRLCAPINIDTESTSQEHNMLDNIVTLFGKSDAEPTRLEASRTVIAICRLLHSTDPLPILQDWDTSGTEAVQKRESFYSKHDLSKLLAFIFVQDKWPILRSEALFVFALMCRSKDGGGVILKMLDEQAIQVLVETITGRKSENEVLEIEASVSGPVADMTASLSGMQLEPQQVDPKQQADIARIDRENCLVLVTEMLKHWGDDMPQPKTGKWQSLIKEGTEMVAKEKAAR